MKATENDIQNLNSLYSGRRAFFGDLHNHSNSGGTSDGKCEMSVWRKEMQELGMDFAAILDHRQVRHMYLPEWEDGVFIGGTEPGTAISDFKGEKNGMHYNMLFENSAPLEKLLEAFPEYEFEGGAEGHFVYPLFTYERMRELIAYVKANDGMFVFPHPKLITESDDPLDYFLADETGIEVFYMDIKSEQTELNYKLWCDLLALGKRLWACAGEDLHAHPSTNALTTIYAEEKKNKSYLSHLRVGDFVCGGVGIKMCIGDCLMGGKTDFDGKNLVVSVSDFHRSVVKDGHTYKLVLINDKGFVAEEKVLADSENVFSFEIENCNFYRVEIFDETENLRIAIGNPIWNINIK